MAIAAGRRDVTPMGNTRTKEFICVRVRLHGSNRQECAERVAAETWEAGASGVEEQALHEGAGEWNRGSAGPGAASNSVGLLLLIYAPREAADGVWAAAQRVIEEGDEALRPEPVETVDWTQAWSRGLRAIEVSERLIVRPSTVACELAPQQQELVVDPGLAFGTGTHASTRLVLDWICQLASSRQCIGPATRVLDVGTGTGLLALAALRLGAGFAVGFDTDPLAPPEALRWARHNSLRENFRVFTGPIEALAGEPFDLVLANLLKSELLPIAPAVAQRVAPGGLLVLSGLLVSERAQVEGAFRDLGFATRGSRDHRDDTGDHWLSLLVARDA